MLIRFFCWYGGKLREVLKILPLLPPDCQMWLEPYMGSASLTLNKFRHKAEILNDRDRGLTNLFQLMAGRDTGKELLERLLKLPYSESEFLRAKKAYADGLQNMDRFQAAELYYVLITQSFNSARKTWRAGVTQQEYTHSLQKNLPFVYERLKGVEIKNMDALDLINSVKNNPKVLAFLDPPYRHELRSKSACSVYEYEMSEGQQIEMLELIRDSKCKIILCGYRADKDDLYDRYLLPYGWTHIKVADLVKSCQTSKSRDVAEEWVWINYKVPESAKYFINLSTINW